MSLGKSTTHFCTASVGMVRIKRGHNTGATTSTPVSDPTNDGTIKRSFCQMMKTHWVSLSSK